MGPVLLALGSLGAWWLWEANKKKEEAAPLPHGTLPPPEGGGVVVLPPQFDPGPVIDMPIGLTGSDFAKRLPNQPTKERESLILAAVKAGAGLFGGFSGVTSEFNGHRAVIPVMTRALRIGVPGDALRVNVKYVTAQQIADALGSLLLTPKVADLIFQQAKVKIPPPNQSWNTDAPPTGSLTSRMVDQSHHLDDLIPDHEPGLIANEGKHWVLTRRNWLPPEGNGIEAPPGMLGSRHNAANYGWHTADGRPIQSTGLAHDFGHTDYSQLVQLMSQSMLVDDVERRTADVLRDPELAGLISAEGPLPGARHPDLVDVA